MLNHGGQNRKGRTIPKGEKEIAQLERLKRMAQYLVVDGGLLLH